MRNRSTYFDTLGLERIERLMCEAIASACINSPLIITHDDAFPSFRDSDDEGEMPITAISAGYQRVWNNLNLEDRLREKFSSKSTPASPFEIDAKCREILEELGKHPTPEAAVSSAPRF